MLIGAAQAGSLRFRASGLLATGMSGALALDLINGGLAANQIVLGDFTSDGTLRAGRRAGSVDGDLASGLVLRDTSPFSEMLVEFVGTDNLSFVFDATSLTPEAEEFGDSFSILLLGTEGQPQLETDDPTGNNALLLLVVDGTNGGHLTVYHATADEGVSWSATPTEMAAVPEPSAWNLALASLLVLGLARLRLGRRGVAALMAGILLAAGAQAENLTSAVQVVRGGLVPNRTTGTFDAQVTVTNCSTDTFLGPLALALESATPAQIALYNSDGRTTGGADYVALPLPAGTLAPGASVSTVVRLLTYGKSVGTTVFGVHGRRLADANSAQIVVSAVYPAGVAGPGETPVGAGWEVSVDGVVRGITDGAGKLSIQAPTDSRTIAVTRPPNEGGSSLLPPTVAGSSTPVKIVVDEGKEIGVGSLVRIEQVRQRVLPRGSAAVTLRFFKDEKAVKLVSLDNVSLVDVRGNYSNLGQLFTLQADGSAAANGADFIQALAGKLGRLRLEVGGSDLAGAVHVASTSFYLAAYRVRVQLVAPPSNQALPLAGVRITAAVLNSDVRFVTQSDANGFIALPDVPAGNLSFSGGLSAGTTMYVASGSAAITRDTMVRLTLRGPADILANVPPLSMQPLPINAMGIDTGRTAEHATLSSEQLAARRSAIARAAQPARLRAPATALIDATSATVAAEGAARNVIAQGAARLPVRQGTKKVTLRYSVFTNEYPTFVLQDSIFDDVWGISVHAPDGELLFDIRRQINSQLTTEPVWRGDGATDEIKHEIDVEALAAASDTALLLYATSVNVGDDRLATEVLATLESTATLLIGAVSSDTIPGAANDGNYYSIPRPSASNLLQRTFDIDVSKPSRSVLRNLSVELRSGSGEVLQTVLQDATPGSAEVQVISLDDTSAILRVRVTHEMSASIVASQPPPARDIVYRFMVTATTAEGGDLRDEKSVGVKRALWRMPDGIARYGRRDAGGDDWVARGTYGWLLTNSGLIREIDDISGEHGRNIRHHTHGRGTDVDTFHFYRFPGAGSGGQNFLALQTNVIGAFGLLSSPAPQAAIQAYNRVAAWVTATRNGLAALAELDSVAQIIYCSGTPISGVAAGWCSALIRTGVISRTRFETSGSVVESLNFGGSFSNAKVIFRNDHNDHVHVTLSAAQIGE
ncbi:hypothetical protein [Rubrivivax sp. A210]|uniref:hypothetical protein n=1 Tax=Rubrivivax sp. A210 TaxID=2772301 RepID=UPI0019185E9C|nr:hypothetical protein [Rubrivivax sp. A210]